MYSITESNSPMTIAIDMKGGMRNARSANVFDRLTWIPVAPLRLPKTPIRNAAAINAPKTHQSTTPNSVDILTERKIYIITIVH